MDLLSNVLRRASSTTVSRQGMTRSTVAPLHVGSCRDVTLALALQPRERDVAAFAEGLQTTSQTDNVASEHGQGRLLRSLLSQ